MIPLTHENILRRLLALPEEIAQAETSAHQLAERYRVTQEVLQRSEDALLLAGRIDGKNEPTRLAQLRSETQSEREALTAAAYRWEEAKITLRRLQNEHSSLRAAARLVGGVE